MAHLWRKAEGGDWMPWRLDEAAIALSARLTPLLPGSEPVALLLRSRSAGHEHWLAMRIGAQPLFVNGEPLVTGIRAISHRDELRLAGSERVFFSAEELPRIEAFVAGPREVLCPRCRRAISAGALTVRCACGTAYHQGTDPAFQCYTYGEQCPLCARPTALTETFQWQPEA